MVPNLRSVMLNRLQTHTYTTNAYYATGAKAIADKPIAVFSGAVCGLGWLFQGMSHIIRCVVTIRSRTFNKQQKLKLVSKYRKMYNMMVSYLQNFDFCSSFTIKKT
jgi:hypothetical protein